LREKYKDTAVFFFFEEVLPNNKTPSGYNI